MYTQNSKRRKTGENVSRYIGRVYEGGLRYPYRLNFYKYPPTFEITMEQFEQWAIDRMKVLGEIESRLARNQNLSDVEIAIKPVLGELLPLNSNRSLNGNLVEIKGGKSFIYDQENEENKRLKDHYSHFILRLAFARSEELRERFIRAESSLFKIRYDTDDLKDRQEFIKSLDLDWESVSEEEISELKDQLIAASGVKSVEREYFKVDFERVVDLVENRKVFLKSGKAYVPISYQQSMVITAFTDNLREALIKTSRSLPKLDEDDRLIPLLNHLSQGFSATSSYLESEASLRKEGQITASMIDGLVEKHFPLCMKTIHHSLLANHHLRYEARRQYGLFLKWIGLDVEEAVKFWRAHFSNITDDKFDKEYKYNIRHQYGLEGGRINYKPISCLEIGKGPKPGRSESHGCPYRTFSEENLVTALQQMGITDKQELAKIRSNVEKHHYHVACTRVYELTHKQDKLGESITYPNQYFDRSYALENPPQTAS